MAVSPVSQTTAAAPPTRKRRNWLPLLMTLPATLAMVGILYPFAIAVYYSFTNIRIVSPDAYKFVGLQNYIRLFQDAAFLEALFNTLLFAFAALVVELVLGFLIAVLLSQQVRGVGIMRAMLLLPLMLAPVIAGLMWKTMLAPAGPINHIFGLGPYPWLAVPWSARFSVVFIEIWMSTPFVALVLLSGLQALPKAPFEAAQVDGAGYLFVFRKLMLPLLQPFILIVLLFRVVDVIKLFDIVFATTSGGPMFVTTTVPILVYKEVFQFYTLGSAISKVLILWVINYVVSFWLAGRWRKSTASIG
jgi:multiple sugar transport system permease protein